MKMNKYAALNNQTLEPHMDLQVVALMSVGFRRSQYGYLATIVNYRSAAPAVVESAISRLRNNASKNQYDLLGVFAESYTNWLVNAGRIDESTTLARYF